MHLADLDNDGNLDLYLSSHSADPAIALLNNGHGVFTLASGTNYPDSEVHLVYDTNEDGKADLSMTYVDGGAQWWRNQSTTGTLNIVATALTRDGNTARTQVLADFNGDGRVDWLHTGPPGIEIDFGDGSGGFTLDSYTLAIPGTDSNDNANIIPGDFDGDGKVDLLVIVGGAYEGTVGHTDLYHNDGIVAGALHFTKQTAAAGLSANGIVVKGVGDYDLDGDLDLIAVENKSLPPVIYRNDGHGVFTRDATAISGISAETLEYAFWGTAVVADFDNDGIPDILMNGKYYLMLLRGTGGGHFVYMNSTWGITDVCPCSIDGGLAFGDIDNDGDLDIVAYGNISEPFQVKVYRNDNPAKNWLRVRPIGHAGNRGATGAKIRLYATGTQQLIGFEEVAVYCSQAAPSYYAQRETERHFGLGARANVDVEVQFNPSGRIVRRSVVPANGVIEIPEDGDVIFADGFQ